MARVKISDPEASLYPFRLHVGDRVESLDNPSLRGKIIDGEYDGAQGGSGGSYTVSYTVEVGDGLVFGAEELRLKKIDQ